VQAHSSAGVKYPTAAHRGCYGQCIRRGSTAVPSSRHGRIPVQAHQALPTTSDAAGPSGRSRSFVFPRVVTRISQPFDQVSLVLPSSITFSKPAFPRFPFCPHVVLKVAGAVFAAFAFRASSPAFCVIVPLHCAICFPTYLKRICE